jgi:uncharacterized protein YkwD
MESTVHNARQGRSKPRPATFIAALIALAVIATVSVAVGLPEPAPAQAGTVDDNDWLGIVNYYRSESDVPPVAPNGGWSSGATAHSCWMLQNGIGHDESPGTPGYTVGGDETGNNSNVAVSTSAVASARQHIELWLAGPFHAIGILRPNLTQSGFGTCTNPATSPWKSAATLDVARGVNPSSPKPATPTLFPGNGTTIGLDRFVAESPDPRTFCGWSGRTVGLPVIAMMPDNVTTASASLTGPNGPIPTCVLTKSNTNGIAASILGGDNAVVVVPAAPLTTGKHTASVNSNGGAANWSFFVGPGANLAPKFEPDPSSTNVLGAATSFHSVTPFRFADSRIGQQLVRLAPNTATRIRVAGTSGIPAGATAVSANFTVANPAGHGFLTASGCGGDPTTFSTLNYLAGETAPNQALVPLSGGDLCLFSNKATDVVIDINGYVSPGGDQFMPVTPRRMLDSRTAGQRLTPGVPLRVAVTGGSSPAPLSASAVAVNITSVGPSSNGWIRAFPCDQPPPVVSTLNPRAGSNRPNSAIVPTGADGTICLDSNVATDVVVDLTGWFGVAGKEKFTPLTPIRLADTRSHHPSLNALPYSQRLTDGVVLKVPVAGVRGVPANARAATLNIVAVSADGTGWVRVVPCGTSSNVSNLNVRGAPAIANGTTVALSSDGAVCVTVNTSTNVVVDITGVWT